MKYLLIGGLAIAFFLGWSQYERKVGELNGKIAHLEQEKARVDTVYRNNTVTLTKVRRITDSVLVTDTVIRVDSVKILLAGERKACDAVITTCEQRVAIRDSIITALKKRPSIISHLPWVLGGIIVGKLILK